MVVEDKERNKTMDDLITKVQCEEVYETSEEIKYEIVKYNELQNKLYWWLKTGEYISQEV